MIQLMPLECMPNDEFFSADGKKLLDEYFASDEWKSASQYLIERWLYRNPCSEGESCL